MIKIGLLSDTHSHLDPKVFEHFKEVDEIWHAGDVGDVSVIHQLEKFKPLRGVYGNIDGHEVRAIVPLDLRMEIEGVKVWMTHIGGYPGRYSPRVLNLLKTKIRPNLFICGHSHILKVMRDKQYNFLMMNPGACGIHGFHKVKTLLRFSLDHGKIKDLEAIELGKRGEI